MAKHTRVRIPKSSGILMTSHGIQDGDCCEHQTRRQFGRSWQVVECGEPATVRYRVQRDRGELEPFEVLAEIKLCDRHVGFIAKEMVNWLIA